MDYDVYNIGENIKERREAKRYTVSAVSEILDIKQSVVKKIENNEISIDEQLLSKFAKLFGCSVSFLQGERELQVIEDDLSDVEKLLNQNLNIIRKQLDRLDKEMIRYLEIKNQFRSINSMVQTPVELPIELAGFGIDITEQFSLLSGVYTCTIIPEEAGHIILELYAPNGKSKTIYNRSIDKPTKTIFSLSEDNTYILKGSNNQMNWKVIIDEAFDV